jgi:hypothetical protein
MVVPRGERRDPHYRVDRRDLAIGEKEEMRYVKSRTQARRIARKRLQDHPTYYDVLPAAERTMRDKERNMKALPKKKKPRPQQQSNTPPGWNSTPWSN